MSNTESPLNQSERVAVSLAALRVHEARPLQEKLGILERAIKLPTVAAALAFVMSACAPAQPPATFSVDDTFSLAEAETIRAAVDGWCEAAGWCPVETLWSERARFVLVPSIEDASDDPACQDPDGCRVGGRNAGDGRVLIAADRPRPDDLGLLWRIAAHEAGHFCTGHTGSGLMSAYMAADGELRIDDVAAAAWHAGCP